MITDPTPMMLTTLHPRIARRRARAALVAIALLSACGGDGRAVTDPAPSQFTLAISNAGTGSGRIVSAPAGIDCQIVNGALGTTGCMASFAAGTAVQFVATAASASQEFAGWSGACAGASACTFTVAANVTLAAAFRARVQTLTLTLQTPNGDDGAMLATLSGPGILAVRPTAGLEVRELRDTVATGVVRSRLIVRGTLTSGAIAEVDVPGGAASSAYAWSIQQVAARASGGYAQRTNLGVYQLTLR